MFLQNTKPNVNRVSSFKIQFYLLYDSQKHLEHYVQFTILHKIIQFNQSIFINQEIIGVLEELSNSMYFIILYQLTKIQIPMSYSLCCSFYNNEKYD